MVELGCGLGVPSLVAAARGARVTAIDWAEDAIELLGAERGSRTASTCRPCAPTGGAFDGRFDLALAADVLYERRNVEPLLELLPRLAAEVWLAEPGPSVTRRSASSARSARAMAAIERAIADRVVPAHVACQTYAQPESTPVRSPHARGRPHRRSRRPFRRSDGAIDFDAFQRLAAHLVDNGSDGLVVAGTTGESADARPTGAARRSSARRSRRSAIARPSSPAPGRTDTRIRSQMTERRHEPASTGSSSSRRTTTSRRSAASSRTSRPSRARPTGRSSPTTSRPASSINIEPETITRLAEIENLTAVKQAHDDLDQARHIVETGLDLYAGDDNILQPFLELGGVGGICVHTHVVGPQVAEQVSAMREGDLERAREIDRELEPAYELLKVVANPIAIKAALNLLGHEAGAVGCLSCRRPTTSSGDPRACRGSGCWSACVSALELPRGAALRHPPCRDASRSR